MADEENTMAAWEDGYAGQDMEEPYGTDGWTDTGQESLEEPGDGEDLMNAGPDEVPEGSSEESGDWQEKQEELPDGMEDEGESLQAGSGPMTGEGLADPQEEFKNGSEDEADILQENNADMAEEDGQAEAAHKEPAETKEPRADKDALPDSDTGADGSDTEKEHQDRTGRQASRRQASKKAGQTEARLRMRPSSAVLSIDGELVAETDAEKAKNDLLDLLESQKTGRILAGTIQGVEEQPSDPSHTLAVIYHGAFKVIIPAEEAVELPEDLKGRTAQEMYHYMMTKRLGAEADYIVKGIDADAGVAVASRLEAMRMKRKEYYTDRGGSRRIRPGICAEARVVSVIRTGIFVDLFGLETYIPLRELSYQRWMDAAAYFQSGQRVLVKVLDVGRNERGGILVEASVKQASENPYEKALRRYSVGNRYVGTVSMVDTNGVFVALDGGIDCLCSYPKRGRPPRGSRATVRILGINDESNRIWGAITHIAAPH